MRILIADDEPHVIEAIRLLVPWEELGIDSVLSADSVAGSIRVMEEHAPQLVVTDTIMGDGTGIDLLRYLNDHYPATKVVAISGYNDYEYVRTMLTLGGLDYLLKPLEADVLIRAVAGAAEAWRRDHRQTEQDRQIRRQISFLSDQYAKTLLSRMLMGEDLYQELSGVDPRFREVEESILLYCDTRFLPLENHSFAGIFSSGMDQLSRYLEDNGLGTLFFGPQGPHQRVALLSCRPDITRREAEKILEELFLQRPCSWSFGVSNIHPFPGGLSAAYEQAKAAFLQGDGNRRRSGFHPPVPGGGVAPPVRTDLEHPVFAALLTGDREGIRGAVEMWLGGIFTGGAAPLGLIEGITLRYREIYARWARQLEQLGAEEGSAVESRLEVTDFFGETGLFSLEMLRDGIFTELSALTGERGVTAQGADPFQRIACYMRLHFNQPFHQGEYAKLFHLNKEYLSRRFKEVFGVSMVSYLVDIRMEEAKKRMADPTLSLRDIANQVGFEDEKYFTRQFKKHTGMTPSQYRGGLRQSRE